MAKKAQLDYLVAGVSDWNLWREKYPNETIDLSEVELSKEILERRLEREFKKLFLLPAIPSIILLNFIFFKFFDKLSEILPFLIFYFIARRFISCYIAVKIISSFLRLIPREIDLQGIDLSKSNLCKTSLRGVNLTNADLSETDLRSANLAFTEAIGTNFFGANLTGACIENWNINSSTNLDNIKCDYAYFKLNQDSGLFDERRPVDPSKNFLADEFSILVRKVLTTYELAFTDGIDWKIFFRTFQELTNKYGEENISVQAIEKQDGGKFIIRLETTTDIDKTEIENLKREYDCRIAIQESELKFQNERLKEYKQEVRERKEESTDLRRIIETMAEKPIFHIDQKGATIGVGFAAEGSRVSFVQHAKQSINLPEQDLVDAAQKIQSLLNQLSQEYPTENDSQQQAFIQKFIEFMEVTPELIKIILAGGIEGLKILCPPAGIPVEMARRLYESLKEQKSQT